MVSDVIVLVPALLRNWAPTSGMRLPLRRPPNARSVLPVAPKLYVSPVLLEPVPAVYVVLALVPDSENSQPSGTALDVPVPASVLKSCVYGVPNAVRSTAPAAATGVAGVAMTESPARLSADTTTNRPTRLEVRMTVRLHKPSCPDPSCGL